MKQRITYLVKDPDTFTPEKLQVKDASITLDAVEAVKEHRITFSLDELPAEFRNIFNQFPALHVKWASTKPYSTIPPFTSRVTPGLHILFSQPHSEDALCPMIHGLFGPDLKCSSTEKTATPVIQIDGAPPIAELQYFSYLPSLDNLVSHLKHSICPSASKSCREAVNSLGNVSYLDIDYTEASPSIVVTAFWDSSPSIVVTAFWDSPPSGWSERLSLPSQTTTTEVGILMHETNPDPEDIAFSGFLTVLGRDTAPKPTRFQTPSKHYPLPASPPQTFTTTFPPPTGLHPTLSIHLPPITPPDQSCTLHTHLTLPSPLFIDRYQFSDPLSLAAHNLVSLRNLTGATDLEAPEWVVPAWGSSALFEVAVPSEKVEKRGEGWEVRIPLHLRYLPASAGGQVPLAVPHPVVFWACDAPSEEPGWGSNPFHRGGLGYEGGFEEATRFMHLVPEVGAGEEELVSWISVPVLDSAKTGWVEGGTIGVVVCAFVGLCWVLFMGGKGGVKKEEEGKKKR